MAYNDSGELPVSQSTYSLGGYTFELKVQTVHEPGEPDVVSVFAICRGPDGTRETQAVDFPENTVVEGWYVEANETEATVYAKTKDTTQTPDISPYTMPIQTGGDASYYSIIGLGTRIDTVMNIFSNTIPAKPGGGVYYLSASTTPNSSLVIGRETTIQTGEERDITADATESYTYAGKTAYYGYVVVYYSLHEWNYIHFPYTRVPNNPGAVAWTMLYGEALNPDPVDGIVGRFAIDIREADTDSWDEPGDDGPPGTTLNVTVTGATAGSCTGTPADNETVKGYGDGGDGGYGGGGGAGASTVIIYEFATDIADSVQQEAISRGPGTGGPGGKGNKGGDGCILIFY